MIRLGRASDLDELVPIALAYRSPVIAPARRELVIATYRQVLAGGLVIVAVSEHDQRILGTIGLERCRHRWTGEAFIGDVWFYCRPASADAASEIVAGAELVAAHLRLPLVLGLTSGQKIDPYARFLRARGYVALGGLFRLAPGA